MNSCVCDFGSANRLANSRLSRSYIGSQPKGSCVLWGVMVVRIMISTSTSTLMVSMVVKIDLNDKKTNFRN